MTNTEVKILAENTLYTRIVCLAGDRVEAVTEEHCKAGLVDFIADFPDITDKQIELAYNTARKLIIDRRREKLGNSDDKMQRTDDDIDF